MALNNEWINFGDVSFDHGQTWIKRGGDDYAECVEILCGADTCVAENQYVIRAGSIYFSPENWDSAMSCCGTGIYGPPTYDEIAYAYLAYQGMDLDNYWRGFQIVQVGKEIDEYSHSQAEYVDVTLHGNASMEKYLKSKYLS